MESAPFPPYTGGRSFVFRSRPRAPPKPKPKPTKPSRKRKRSEAHATDVEATSWAPDVPECMLFIHRAYPEGENKSLVRQDWNTSKGPLEMYEHTFDATSGTEDGLEVESSQSHSSLDDNISEPQTPMDLAYIPSQAVVASGSTNVNPKFDTQALHSILQDHPGVGHCYDSLPVPVPPSVYPGHPPAGGFTDASALPLRNTATEIYSPADPQFRLAEQYIPSIETSREVTPFSQGNSFHHIHAQSPVPPHYKASEPLRPLNITPQPDGSHLEDHTRQGSENVPIHDHADNVSSLRALPLQDTFYATDPRQFYATHPSGRRLSLPALTPSNLPPSLPLFLPSSPFRFHQPFLGPNPNQSSYFAPLLLPRAYSHPPEYMIDDPTRRGPVMPWPHPSLAQFAGTGRLSYPEIPRALPSAVVHPMGAQVSHLPASPSVVSVASSLPPSGASSPLPSPALSSTSVFTYPCYTEPRPEIKRAASWTAHFDQLPAPKLKIRTRRSRAANAPDEKTVGDRMTMQSLIPNLVLLHQCPMCPRAFERRNGLAIHLKWHYKPESPPKEEIPGTGTMGILTLPGSDKEAQETSVTMPTEDHEPRTIIPDLMLPEDSPSEQPTESSWAVSSSNRADALSITNLLYTDSANPSPITPLATPPPSPGQSAGCSAKAMGSAQLHGRAIWPELFGSDD